MKKFLVFLILVSFIFVPFNNGRAEENLISGAKSGLLMEVSTGEILFEKNINDELAIASMTKMMSQILILEAVEKGQIKWEDKVQVSSNAAGFGGSQIWLTPNEVMSVRDLMKGVSMASANDATVALAEYIAGSESEFVNMMNDKAKELGLTHTNYVNSTGLDEENHYSSSYDLALVARHLLLEHPEILEFSSVYEDYLRTDTPNKFWLVNTNKLVRFYDGADGLKTGHTDNAKYCMAVTAKKGDMRLLAVVLGEESAQIRNGETTTLLDYGFNNYKFQVIKDKDEVVENIKLEKAESFKRTVSVFPKENIGILLKKTEEGKSFQFESRINDVKLPLNKGDSVGSLIVKNEDGSTLKEVPLIVVEDVKKASFFEVWFSFLKGAVTGAN